MLKKQNLLTMIPKKNDNVQLKTEKEKAQIIFSRNSKIDKILCFIFNAPKEIKIELDKLGGRVFELIDGSRTVLEISTIIKEEFREKAEPLIPRLADFIRILKKNKFISFKS